MRMQGMDVMRILLVMTVAVMLFLTGSGSVLNTS